MKSRFNKCLSILLLSLSILCLHFNASANHYTKDDSLTSKLNRLSLPGYPITEDDLPGIEYTIHLALSQITEHIEYMHKIQLKNKKFKPELLGNIENDAGQAPLIVGLHYLEDWLTRQKCVYQVSMPIIHASGKYAVKVLTSYPGKLPITISFNIKNESPRGYSLALYIGPASLNLAYLSEMNK